jgi:hypothetical protein
MENARYGSPVNIISGFHMFRVAGQ